MGGSLHRGRGQCLPVPGIPAYRRPRGSHKARGGVAKSWTEGLVGDGEGSARPRRWPGLVNRNVHIYGSPQRQKQQTLEVLVAWLLAATAQQPLLSIWEDLHWADPSTLELLGLVLDQAPTARLLLVLTARPAFRPPWSPRSYLTPLALTRLLGSQVEELVLRITGGKALPAEVLRQIVEKTDGVPLFVEELVKTILEAGLVREDAGGYGLNGPLPPLAIPTTLQDALMARLDRLAAVKTVAQVAAVLGRELAELGRDGR